MLHTNTNATDLQGDHNSLASLRRQIADGLLYTHSRLNANQRKTLEAASFLYALVELLSERA